MSGHDFEVDLEALLKAAQGASETIKALKDGDVSDLTPTRDSVGDDDLAEAICEFNDRWEISLNAMTEDIGEVAGRLSQVAKTYADFDAETHKTFAARTAAFTSLNFPGGSGAAGA
jgi:hypothetical protein